MNGGIFGYILVVKLLIYKDIFFGPKNFGVSEEEGLSVADAAAYFEPLVAVVHGYASLIANNAIKYDPDAIRKVLIAIAEGLERG